MTRNNTPALIALTTTLCIVLFTVPVSASLPVPVPESPETLSLVRIKMTAEEYIELQNNTTETIADLSVYYLRSYNNVDSTVIGASTASQSLPSLPLGPGERLLLSSGIRPTCSAAVAGKLSLSLVDGGGTLQIMQKAVSEDETPTVIDSVSWSSSVKGDIPSVPSSSKSPLTAYYRYGLGEDVYAWQKADQSTENVCELVVITAVAETPITVDVSLPDQSTISEPFTVSVDEQEIIGAVGEITTRNQDLEPIQISELLPNPIGTGNDTSDEFIELYNPNGESYDLTGYVLRSGVSTLRYYAFATGTIVPAKSYAVFTSSDTGLPLSNTTGQVTLLSPDKSTMTTTAVYRTAKDGYTWIYENSEWQWTTTSTPGNSNTLTTPVSSQQSKSSKSTATKKTVKSATAKTPKAPKAAKVPKEKKPKALKVGTYNVMPTAATVQAKPIQSGIIASIALIALLYGAYEYRGDLANKYQQCRRHISAWRTHRR